MWLALGLGLGLGLGVGVGVGVGVGLGLGLGGTLIVGDCAFQTAAPKLYGTNFQVTLGIFGV